ncbi:hypothetical protein JAO29_19770 [Edaphobacter sp. HDX4]|uniref:hypothetical protein n=1 Tax=Edaphobacter sp. HDX4 TaxID=2794064 RepID=UPI002FE6707B
MSRIVALSNSLRLFSGVTRYGIAIVSVAGASAVASLLQHFGVRDPLASIFLAALAVSFWYGRTGPGVLGMVLATWGLNVSSILRVGGFISLLMIVTTGT